MIDMENNDQTPENPQHDVKLPVVGSASLMEAQIAHQMEMDDEEDSYWEDEDNFQCCDNCDLPDACCVFGCAIQQGLREDEGF
jgi:hypothetical protein